MSAVAEYDMQLPLVHESSSWIVPSPIAKYQYIFINQSHKVQANTGTPEPGGW